MPTDFYYGLERTMQDMKLSDGRSWTQQRNFRDDVRFYHAVKSVINDRSTIGDIVGIIIDDALNDLPDEALEKIHDAIVGKATSVSSRTVMQLAVSSWLESKVVSGLMGPLIVQLSMRFATGMLTGDVIAQGVVARACESSRRLQLTNPALWQRLYINDYDLLYFWLKSR
ncbi:hypothetical protein ACFFW8_14150 [Erwinia tracheiphila]